MKLKLEDYIPKENQLALSKKQKKNIWYAIRNKIPILFVGEAATGKTFLAKMLREKGVTAYAPEKVSTIMLGETKSKEMKQAMDTLSLHEYLG